MVSLSLLDVVISDAAAERSSAVAAQLVQSALSEYDRIKQLDGELAPRSNAEHDRHTAVLIRGMYEDWARQADALLDRVTRVQKRFGPVADSEKLGDMYGRTRAMLSVTLEQIERARRDVAEGRTIPMEEVRRELRLRTHK